MLWTKRSLDPDSAWKLQNKEQKENPLYKYINLQKGGRLVDVFVRSGEEGLERVIRSELECFLYNKGKGGTVTKVEYLRWKDQITAKMHGEAFVDERTDEQVLDAAAAEGGPFVKDFVEHEACWDIHQRGSVGESVIHLTMLFSDTYVFREIAKILLKIFPKLALDFYEGDEYYGESGLHLAIVYRDFELVKLFVVNGAFISQRAMGRFFLPEDQKNDKKVATDYYGYAYYGEYPLAFAACSGDEEIYDYLIDHGADPNLQDSFGNTVLHMMVISNQTSMFSHAVKHHTKRALMEISNHQKLTPLTLASKMGRMQVFNEIIELQSYEIWRYSNITCSVYPLAPLDTIGKDGKMNQNAALIYITDGDTDGHLEMLDDGIIKQLLADKWKKYGRKRFFERLMLALFHLITLSVAIYTRPDEVILTLPPTSVDATTIVRYVAESIVAIYCFLTIVMQIFEVRSDGGWEFLKRQADAPAKCIFNISCVLILLCIPMRLSDQQSAERILLALAAPCSWALLLFFARGLSLYGPLVVTIYTMLANDLIRFLIIYLIMITLAIQAFYFLFKGVVVPDNQAYFKDIDGTIMKLFEMTLGEYQEVYDVFDETAMPWLTKLVFILFAIFVPILLLNMLIAMFVHTYEQIIRRSEKEWKRQWAKIIIVLERTYTPEKLLRFQEDYSVKFAGQDDSRGLMVIKTMMKTKARQRKEAISNWKRIIGYVKTIVKDNMNRESGAKLRTSYTSNRGTSNAKKDVVQETSPAGILAAAKQLAWEKDIDLNKGNKTNTKTNPSGDGNKTNPSNVPGDGAICLTDNEKLNQISANTMHPATNKAPAAAVKPYVKPSITPDASQAVTSRSSPVHGAGVSKTGPPSSTEKPTHALQPRKHERRVGSDGAVKFRVNRVSPEVMSGSVGSLNSASSRTSLIDSRTQSGKKKT